MTNPNHDVERFECCMTCGSVVLPEDEGACDCDFRGNEKARVDVVLASDYEREEWRGKAEHRLHEWRLRVDDAKAAEASASAWALAWVRELQLRLADAYEVIATAVPRDEEGEPDYDKTEAVEEILGGGFFSALEFALTGGLGCLSEEEQAEKREAALREHREVLELSTLEDTQGEGT